MNDTEYEQWVTGERRRVKDYLEGQGLASPNVGWPAFDVPPYFAIWAVESQRVPGKVGWWAFSGDCPTDYVSEDGTCHPRDALKLLLERWRTYVPSLKAGRQPAGVRFGDGASLETLGELLESRVGILAAWHEDDGLWKDL